MHGRQMMRLGYPGVPVPRLLMEYWGRHLRFTVRKCWSIKSLGLQHYRASCHGAMVGLAIFFRGDLPHPGANQ